MDPSYDAMWSQDAAAYQYPPYEEQFLNQQQGLSIGMTSESVKAGSRRESNPRLEAPVFCH